MPTVLATKLYIPPARVKAVAQPRLYQKLSEGLFRPLTVISAPAGFGKSTLLNGPSPDYTFVRYQASN